MKRFTPFSALLACYAVLLPGLALAQTGTITGTVIDSETGEPLPGANVILPRLNLGSATDIDGSFSIQEVPTGSQTITASFVGYRTSETTVDVAGGENELNFELQPDYTGLEEIVVTGIASSTSKARSEVAVSRVDAEELTESNSYQDLSQLIGGKVAGLNVQPASGNVGGGIRFNVRGGGGLNGQGQPVIYVDGVRVDNDNVEGYGAGGQNISALADINPEDIADIEFLKGAASAAIYGTEGANGVVLITTKRGSLAQGSNLRVRYKGVFGYNEQDREFSAADYETAADANALFRDGGIQQHSLSFSGGAGQVSYFASVDNRREDGITVNNSGNRTTFRANFDAFPSEVVTLRASAGYTINEIQRPENDNNIFGLLGNTLLLPTPYGFTDSLAVIAIEDVQSVNRFIGSLEGSYAPIRGLELGITLGYDGSDRRQDKVYPQNFAYSGTTNGERNSYFRRNNQFNTNVNGRYGYDITERLQATSIVGAQFIDVDERITFTEVQNFATELIEDIGAGSDIQEVDETFLNERQGGIYAQQELAYDDTYFLTGLLRRDFASAIGDEASTVLYPGIRGAVRLDQFGAFPSAFTLFKPRVAYGETGNLPSLLDAQALRYQAIVTGVGGGASVGTVGNVAIVPERVQEIEAGADVELFGQYGAEFTYYRTYTNDSIIEFDVAPSTGFFGDEAPLNVGQVQAQGVELALTATPISTPQTQLDLGFTYAYQTSEVTDLGGSPPIYDGFDLNVYREGLPRSAFYTPAVLGATFDEEGEYDGVDVQEADADTDPEVDPDAAYGRTYFGQPFPEHFGAFRANLRLLGGLELYALVDYATGFQVFNNTKLFAARFGNYARRNELADQLFDETDDDGNVVREAPLEPGTPEYTEAANAYARTNGNYDANFIEDGDYLKLREVTISYDFSSLVQRAGVPNIRSFRVALTGRNLLTSTKYSGPDPEVNFDGSRSLSRGQDFLTLQTPRTYTLTLSLGL